MRSPSSDPVLEKPVPIAPSAVLAALDEVTASASFAKAERPARFLRHLVEAALRGEAFLLKESVLGVEVFGRAATWDPRLDGIVRQEAARLRKRLARYYETEGAQAAVRIQLPAGGYVPVFVNWPEPVKAPAAAELAAPQLSVGKWIAAVAMVVCAAGALAGWGFSNARLARPTGISSIAVLGFANLSPDPANQYFADGLTDEITDLLARNHALRVTARSSATHFAVKSTGLLEVGRQLGVTNVLEGSVDRSGDRIRIIAHLERVSDGSLLWSNTYERQAADLFAVQSELAQAIAGNLKAAAGLSAPRHIPNAEAHELYLKGRYELQQMTAASIERGESDFQQAIAMDPAYAAAYAGLGSIKFDRSAVGNQTRTEADRKGAVEAFKKALELDPEQIGAHAALAALKMQYDWDWAGAERELQQAMEHAPDKDAITYYASLMIYRGRFAEAEPFLQRAQDLDPFGTVTLANLGMLRLDESRYSDARDLFRKVSATAPSMMSPQYFIAFSYVCDGRPELGLRQFQSVIKPVVPVRIFEAMAQARAGNREEALRLVRPFEEKYPHAGVPNEWFALVYGLMGDEANTVKWMERSADAREWQALTLAVNPAFESLRKSPGLLALKKRMGL